MPGIDYVNSIFSILDSKFEASYDFKTPPPSLSEVDSAESAYQSQEAELVTV